MLQEFAARLLAAFGVDAGQCKVVAENLIWNDLAGRGNHGVGRLPILLERVKRGLIKCPCTPKFDQLADNIQRLDGDNGFGQYIGARALHAALKMAQTHGSGIVGVHNSNFFGTGAYFIERAAQSGMIALTLSNSFAKVAAFGGVTPVLGTNPFAFGAPRRNGRALLVDMSTAGLAGSTLRDKMTAGETLPQGLLIDAKGQPVTDPARARDATLLPAAGAKGFGLALMVEMLSAVLTGAGMSGQVGSLYKDFGRASQSGHFFLVLDIRRWMAMDEFYDRFEMLIAMIKASGEGREILLPGETRWKARKLNLETGIPLIAKTRQALVSLAVTAKVSHPWGD